MTSPQKVKHELARRELARRRLLHFTKQTYVGPTEYQAGWVHDDICRRLERFSQAVVERKSPRLMLLMPPRHGKSELASIRFPAWHLGRNPTHELINVGYNLDLPMNFSRQIRDLFRDPTFTALFPAAQLNPDSQGLESWKTTKNGGFLAAGRGGGITGKGAHILIVDDPLKNQEEADSAVTRDSLWSWFLSTAYTRLAPGGGVLVIQTHWNDDDLAGRLQQLCIRDPDADQYEVVKYPALAEHFEYRHKETLVIERRGELAEDLGEEWELLREPGQALHPDRYNEKTLRGYKATQEPRFWSALYQQNPIPDEGLVFKKEDMRYQVSMPDPFNVQIITAWDFAISEKQTNDYTVGCTLLRDANDVLYLVDLFRGRVGTYEICEAVLDMYERWGNQPGSQYLLGVEDGQIWKALEPVLRRRMQERKLFPPYEVLKPLTDKRVRASPLQGRVQQHRLIIPENAPWRPDVDKELLRFPGGVHDDIVDALAWAVRLTLGRAAPRRANVVPLKSWRDKLTALVNQDGQGGSHMAA